MTFSCPLCGTPNNVFPGDSDSSGNSYPPAASCACGFRYAPNAKLPGIVGETGWEWMGREHKETLRLIREKLKVIE